MKYKTPNDALLDLYIEELESCSEDELLEMMNQAGLDSEKEYQKTMTGIEKVILQAKKSKLIKARSDLNALSNSNAVKSVFSDAKAKMIDFIQSGDAPPEITMAFRSGEEISDEQMATILQDLIDLGVDIDEM